MKPMAHPVLIPQASFSWAAAVEPTGGPGWQGWPDTARHLGVAKPAVNISPETS